MQSLKYTLRMLTYTNKTEVLPPPSFCHQYFFFILTMEGKWCFGHEEIRLPQMINLFICCLPQMHNDSWINTTSAEYMFLYVAPLCLFTMTFEIFSQVDTKITWLGFKKKKKVMFWPTCRHQHGPKMQQLLDMIRMKCTNLNISKVCQNTEYQHFILVGRLAILLHKTSALVHTFA